MSICRESGSRADADKRRWAPRSGVRRSVVARVARKVPAPAGSRSRKIQYRVSAASPDRDTAHRRCRCTQMRNSNRRYGNNHGHCQPAASARESTCGSPALLPCRRNAPWLTAVAPPASPRSRPSHRPCAVARLVHPTRAASTPAAPCRARLGSCGNAGGTGGACHQHSRRRVTAQLWRQVYSRPPAAC